MSPRAASAPTGTVAFLLTDLEASGQAWRADAWRMDASLVELDRVIARAVEGSGGRTIKPRGEGDSHFTVFSRASDALIAAHRIQTAGTLTAGSIPLRVRAAVHVGEVTYRGGDYYGITANQAARLRSIAHGGQVVLSPVAAALASDHLPSEPGLTLRSLGIHRVRDFVSPIEVFQLHGPGLRVDFPPLRTLDGVDGLTTIVCIDAVAVRDQLEPMNDRAVAEWTRLLVAGVRRSTDRHRAAWVKFTGDGCLAAFADPAVALQFIEDVRHDATTLDIELRAGIDVSCATTVEGELAAAAIFGAHELASMAHPGETKVSAQLQTLLQRSGTPPR